MTFKLPPLPPTHLDEPRPSANHSSKGKPLKHHNNKLNAHQLKMAKKSDKRQNAATGKCIYINDVKLNILGLPTHLTILKRKEQSNFSTLVSIKDLMGIKNSFDAENQLYLHRLVVRNTRLAKRFELRAVPVMISAHHAPGWFTLRNVYYVIADNKGERKCGCMWT